MGIPIQMPSATIMFPLQPFTTLRFISSRAPPSHISTLHHSTHPASHSALPLIAHVWFVVNFIFSCSFVFKPLPTSHLPASHPCN